LAADLEAAREALREWAWYYKDRKTRLRCGSIEKAYRSPQRDMWDPPEPRRDMNFHPLRAWRTWMHVRVLPSMCYRAITWRYCLNHLPLGMCLRSLSRATRRPDGSGGFKVNEQMYDEYVSRAEFRVAVALYKDFVDGYILGQSDLPADAERFLDIGAASRSLARLTA
jgi:hypothetical protein